METDASESSFHRLLGVLVSPPQGGFGSFILSAYQLPFAALESPSEGAVIALVDGPRDPALRPRLDRLVGAPVSSALYLVLVGGGAEAREMLREVDRAAPDPNKLGVYHLDDAGVLVHVAGRRHGLLQAARAWMASAPPFSAADLPALVERVAAEREQAARFLEALHKRPARATIVFGSVCVLLFLLSFVFGGSEQRVAMLMMGALKREIVLEGGRWWTLVSYGFLHGGVLHLLLNMLALVGFGAFLEGLVGWRRFVLLYGAGILGGGIASAALGPGPTVGASGGIWGLFGAGLALMLWPRGVLPLALAQGMRRRLFVTVALNAVFSFMPQIDKWAHFGGGLAGFLFVALGGFGRAPAGAPDGAREGGTSVTVAAVAVVALMLACIVVAVVTGRPWQAEELARWLRSQQS